MASAQHIEHRDVRILTAEKIASLNNDDLRSYRRATGLALKEARRDLNVAKVRALTWAFREASRETERRNGKK